MPVLCPQAPVASSGKGWENASPEALWGLSDGYRKPRSCLLSKSCLLPAFSLQDVVSMQRLHCQTCCMATLPCLNITYQGLEVLCLEVANEWLILNKKTGTRAKEDGGGTSTGRQWTWVWILALFHCSHKTNDIGHNLLHAPDLQFSHLSHGNNTQ